MALRRYLPASVWLLAVVGLSTAAAFDPRGWRRDLKLRDEARALETKNAAMTEENQRLSREARALKTDPAAMEHAVRDELGFIHPGEMMLQLHAAPPAVPAPRSPTAQLPSPPIPQPIAQP